MSKCPRVLAGALGALLLVAASPNVPAEVAPQPGKAGEDPYVRANPVVSDAEFIGALNLDFPGMERVKAALASNDLPAAKAAYLEYRRHACPARWTVQPTDRPTEARASADPAADAVLAHHLSHPGFKDAEMGKDFIWTYNPLATGDPTSSDEWTYWVSRTEFWNTLSSAYWRTLEDKYAAGWVEQLEDFAAKNPLRLRPPAGKPSLWRTLDSAIRIANSWPNAYYHFLFSNAMTPEVNWLYAKLNYEHGLFLSDGLKNLNRHGNWVTTESKGLYTVGVLFPEMGAAEPWRQTALDRVMREAAWSVFPDGFEKELTPTYHFVTLDALSSTLDLARLNHQELPEKLRQTILGMYRAAVLVMDQSGHDVPTNDSYSVNAASEARQGLKLGDDPLLLWAATHGKEGVAPPNSTALPYAGFYAMRGGWKPDDVFLFFRGGPAGIGHEHEDMLEVVLRAWNRTLLFDPGNYNYDHSDFRRFTIGTASHNTIIVDGKWQHRGATKLDENPPQVTGDPWVTTPLYDFVAATYDAGYQQSVYKPVEYSPQTWVGELDKSVSHTRRVLFLRPHYALVLDTLDGTGKHVFDALFHLDAPAATLDPATQAAFSKNPNGAQLALYPLEPNHLTTDIVQGQKDPLLGWYTEQHRAIPTVRFRKEQDAPAIFATFLYPYEGSAPRFDAKPLGSEIPGVWARSLTTPLETAEVALRLTPDKPGAVGFTSALVGPVQAEATLLLVRRFTSSEAVYVGADNLTSFRDKTVAFTLDTPGSLVFLDQGGTLLTYNAGQQPATLRLASPFASVATLPPNAWTLLSPQGTQPAPAPALLAPAQPPTESSISYVDYSRSASPNAAPRSAPIVVPAAQMILPQGAASVARIGSHGSAVIRWDDIGSILQVPVDIPDAGWYRIKLRYCSGDDASRALLIGGKPPFAEAAHILLASTQGPLPSNGWSSVTDDWREVTLGAGTAAPGWKFYLPQGRSEIALLNDGGGSNVDWLQLDPVQD